MCLASRAVSQGLCQGVRGDGPPLNSPAPFAYGCWKGFLLADLTLCCPFLSPPALGGGITFCAPHPSLAERVPVGAARQFYTPFLLYYSPPSDLFLY